MRRMLRACALSALVAAAALPAAASGQSNVTYDDHSWSYCEELPPSSCSAKAEANQGSIWGSVEFDSGAGGLVVGNAQQGMAGAGSDRYFEVPAGRVHVRIVVDVEQVDVARTGSGFRELYLELAVRGGPKAARHYWYLQDREPGRYELQRWLELPAPTTLRMNATLQVRAGVMGEPRSLCAPPPAGCYGTLHPGAGTAYARLQARVVSMTAISS